MSGYTQAWLLIIAMGMGGGLALHRLLRFIAWPVVRWSLTFITVLLLVVPAPIPGHEGTWAPAFIVAVFELFFQIEGEPTSAILMLGVALGAGLALGVLTALFAKRLSKPAAPAAAADADQGRTASEL